MPQADTRPPTEPFPPSLCFTSGPLGFAVSFLSKQDTLFISGQTAERSEGWGPILICNDQMRRSCFQGLGWSLGGGWKGVGTGLAFSPQPSALGLGRCARTGRQMAKASCSKGHRAPRRQFHPNGSRHSAQIFSSLTSPAVLGPFFFFFSLPRSHPSYQQSHTP